MLTALDLIEFLISTTKEERLELLFDRRDEMSPLTKASYLPREEMEE